MIALRLLLGKTSTPSTHQDRLGRLSPAPPATEAEYKLQKALDENTLQRLLIDQLQNQLTAQSDLILAQQDEQQRQPSTEDYTALQQRVAQLEARLAESATELAASVEAHAQAKAHIAALQQQRMQLVVELEQMEDGFHAELDKVTGELKSWQRDVMGIDEHQDSPTPELSTSPSTSSQGHARSGSNSSFGSRAAILTASLERAKSATRIWALEDEVDRVRHERDALRRRLDTGRANLMQLKRRASEVQGRLGGGVGGRERGTNKSETNLSRPEPTRSKGMSFRGSDVQLNKRVRPVMRGEPITPETSDDARSLEMAI